MCLVGVIASAERLEIELANAVVGASDDPVKAVEARVPRREPRRARPPRAPSHFGVCMRRLCALQHVCVCVKPSERRAAPQCLSVCVCVRACLSLSVRRARVRRARVRLEGVSCACEACGWRGRFDSSAENDPRTAPRSLGMIERRRLW